MDRKEYQDAFDQLSFSADFQQRTADLLRQRARGLEKEHNTMKFKLIRKPAVIAAAAALLAVSVSAAALWLTPAQVALHHDQPALAQAFESKDALVLNERVEAGDFAVTLLGLVSGSGLTDFEPEADAGRTYAVVMLNRLDGMPLENESFDFIHYTLTPLVAGYSPSVVNNWTLDAFATGFAQDGTYYYLLDTQSLEIFAHRTVYLAFYEDGAPSRDIFAVAQDGSISFNPSYEGAQALFTLPLDADKADPEAADAFVEAAGLDLDYNAPIEERTPLTVRESETPDGKRIEILPGQSQDTGLDNMSVEEYQAYMDQEMASMKEQVKAGTLSQKNYDKAVQEMEDTLAGLKDGTLAAAKLPNGGISVMTAPQQAAGDGLDVSYRATEDGLATAIRDAK